MPEPSPDELPLAKGRFIWPPTSPSSNPAGPIVLPPAAEHEPLRRAFARTLARPPSTRVQILDQCEDHWLDLTHPSFARRTQDAAWFPDLPGSYCPRCGSPAGPHGADALGCPQCTGKRPAFERLIRLGSFEGLLRDLVHEVKFDAQRTLGRRLGHLLGDAIACELDRAHIDRARVLIVPMPTTFRRRMLRGIDHAAILAAAVRSRTGGRLAHPIRKRHRPSQVEVNPSERERNMARAFWSGRWTLGPRLSGAVVIVVDDVTTTGATLRGACRGVLAAWRKQSGARASSLERPRVWASVLGVTPRRENQPSGPGRGQGAGPEEPGQGRTGDESLS